MPAALLCLLLSVRALQAARSSYTSRPPPSEAQFIVGPGPNGGPLPNSGMGSPSQSHHRQASNRLPPSNCSVGSVLIADYRPGLIANPQNFGRLACLLFVVFVRFDHCTMLPDWHHSAPCRLSRHMLAMAMAAGCRSAPTATRPRVGTQCRARPATRPTASTATRSGLRAAALGRRHSSSPAGRLRQHSRMAAMLASRYAPHGWERKRQKQHVQFPFEQPLCI